MSLLTGHKRNLKLHIRKKSNEQRIKNKTITYGEAPANDGVEYNGLVNSETESDLGGTLS